MVYQQKPFLPCSSHLSRVSASLDVADCASGTPHRYPTHATRTRTDWPQLDERLGGNRLDQSFPTGLDVFQQIQGQRFQIGHETSGIQVTDGNKRNTSPYYTILHCTPEVADWRSHKAPQTSFTYPALSFSSPGSHRHGIGSVWATNG